MLEGKQLQLLVENVKDRLVGVPGLTADALIPMETPGIETIIKREINRVVAKVENQIKLSLSPKRLTNLPKTPQIAYENKLYYETLGVFTTPESYNYPAWEDLTDEQKAKYTTSDGTVLYKNGTIPWDLMTRAQKEYLSTRIIYVPNKVGNEEKLDGKKRSHIKLRNRYVLKIHKMSLEVRNPTNSNGNGLLMRIYRDSEFFLYEKTGEVILVPLYSQLGMSVGQGTNYTSYGLNVPALPQVIHVDYTYGLDEIPLDLMDAAAMLVACKVFESVNMMFAQGLMSYSVQGFSASFGKGLYTDTMERYQTEANQILDRYKVPFMSAQ